jgi:hypothetical protein
MLEYCLRQLKAKNAPKDPEEKELDIPIPQRRPKTNKTQLNK